MLMNNYCAKYRIDLYINVKIILKNDFNVKIW